MGLKYIVVSNGKREFPIIFPSDFIHKYMLGAVQGMFGGDQFLQIVSAGEWYPISGKCSGESEILKIKSRLEDSNLIHYYNYSHGIVEL